MVSLAVKHNFCAVEVTHPAKHGGSADSCQEETKSFLACKEEWKAEIEEKLEKLKIIERELSNKEKQLVEVRNTKKRKLMILFVTLCMYISQKELQLKAKEKRLETLSRKSEVHYL